MPRVVYTLLCIESLATGEMATLTEAAGMDIDHHSVVLQMGVGDMSNIRRADTGPPDINACAKMEQDAARDNDSKAATSASCSSGGKSLGNIMWTRCRHTAGSSTRNSR